jgi:hypothetical protein
MSWALNGMSLGESIISFEDVRDVKAILVSLVSTSRYKMI